MDEVEQRPDDRPVEDPREQASEGQVPGPLPQDDSAADLGRSEDDADTPGVGTISRSG